MLLLDVHQYGKYANTDATYETNGINHVANFLRDQISFNVDIKLYNID